MGVILRILINAAALWAATKIVPGVSFDGSWTALLLLALVFGVLNVCIKPILIVLTFPLLLLSLGLFTFVVNALMLWLTSAASNVLGLGFHVSGFFAAFFGSLVVTIVSFMLSLFVSAERHGRHISREA